MTSLLRLMILSVLIASLCACDSEPVEETVWDEQIETLDKAREVEDKLMNRAEQLSRDLGNTDEDEDKDDPPR